MKREIVMRYKTNEKNRIQIFGEDFVKNYKNKCKIKINGKENKLTAYYENELKSGNEIEIILVGIDKINSMESLFSDCSSLTSLPDISKWNTSNIVSMRNLFNGCSSLTSLPDISNGIYQM